MNQESEPSVFTRIINREIPADILWESENVIVVKDIRQDAPVHLLGITKHPYTSIDDLLADPTAPHNLLWEVFSALREVAVAQGIDKTGYRFVTNHGADAHQIVNHLHVHLLGGGPLDHAN